MRGARSVGVTIAAIAAIAMGACARTSSPPAAPSLAPVTSVMSAESAAPAASSPAPDATTPDAPFRASRPPAGPDPELVTPTPERIVLANGVPVLIAARHDLPVVEIDVVVRGGYADVPRDLDTSMRVLGRAMVRGTRARTARAISEVELALGADVGVWVEQEVARAKIKVLAPKLGEGLELFSDLVLHPAFSATEIEKLKSEISAGLEQQKLDSETLAWNAVEASLYGPSHPYGRSYLPTAKEIAALSPSSLARAHRRAFAADRATIVVVGDVDARDVAARLGAAFSGWKKGSDEGRAPLAAIAVPAPGRAPALRGPRLVLVERPGATQSLVYVAEPALAAASPDRDAFAVMSTVLGGFWMSRLNANLREGHGYSYWVSTRQNARRAPGPYMAGGAMVAAKTGAAITEILREIEAMRATPLAPDELEGAKRYRTRSIAGQFETVGSSADAFAWLLASGLPLDDYATRPARFAAITSDDVLRVARAYLHPDRMKIIVVADRAVVEPQLRALGLGPIERRDAYGDVVKEQ